jgi:CRP-like cAMP-binding protein
VALFFETGGKREIFQTLTPVDTFGEAELLSGEKRKTGAVASSDSILCALDRSSFLDLLSVDRQVALSFSELISRRLILLQEKLGS